MFAFALLGLVLCLLLFPLEFALVFLGLFFPLLLLLTVESENVLIGRTVRPRPPGSVLGDTRSWAPSPSNENVFRPSGSPQQPF